VGSEGKSGAWALKCPRAKFRHPAAGAAALPLAPRVVRAQAYPTRPVRIIVGFGAGGGADFGARLIGQWLSQRLGQQFIIENRPGAASNLAAEAVVRGAPNRHTLLPGSAVQSEKAAPLEKANFYFHPHIAADAGN